MFCSSGEVFRVRLPASDAPIKLASPFTSYKDIVKNAVVWTYFDWLKAERPSGLPAGKGRFESVKCPCADCFLIIEGAVR
jgi:hypothetical protein